MKTAKILLLLVLIMLLPGCQGPELPPRQTVVVTPTAEAPAQEALDPFAIAWDDRSLFRAGLTTGQAEILGQLAQASDYRLEVHLDESLAHLRCRQAVRYTNQEQDTLNEICFRLFPNILGGALDVESLDVDGIPVGPSFDPPASAMRVLLPEPLPPSQRAVIEMAFRLDIPTSGEGNYGMFGLQDGVLALAHFFPIIPAYDEEGWHDEIPPRHGDLLYADIAYFLVSVRAAASVTLVASGTEVGRTVSPDQQHVMYAAGPMRDYYLVVSEGFERVTARVGDTSVNSYAPRQQAEGARAVLQYATKAVQVFNARFGRYPFTELDLVTTPTSAYGIEYPGIVALAVRLYGPESAYPPVYLESTVAHEVSHQWFYGVVGNDQQGDPWLDEALAQYSTVAYYEDTYGPAAADGFRSSLYERWQRVDDAPIPIGLSVSDYTATEYGAIVYGRGPLFIEALASAMGEANFDRFLRDYYQSNSWGVATTAAFQQLAEDHCSCDLDGLFQQWVGSR